MTDIFEEIVRLRRDGTPAALATIIATRGSTPGRETMRLLVRADGTFLGTVGGGCLEAEVYETAKSVLRDEKARTLHFRLTEFESPENGLLCGGEVTVFIEALSTPTLLVFGGGHISRILAHVAHLAGFRVEIAEDRDEFATTERFPEAARLHVGSMRELGETLPLGPTCYVVVVTRGHKGDGEVLEGLAKRATSSAEIDHPRYLGMIGSKVKRVVLFKKLMQDHAVPEAWLSAVRSPVGLDIGARSHEEIAIAIVAEMIQVRRNPDSATKSP
ncbi:MAG: XdhC family protein [Planctomycetes bacterium]|nr:XdhC family protein [Planctomycetota bacterium]